MNYDRTKIGIDTHRNEVKSFDKFLSWKRIGIFSLFVLLLIMTIRGASAYVIDGNTVSIEDSNVLLKLYPHTIQSHNQDVFIEFMSKQFNGNITVIFGYNDSYIRPRSFNLIRKINQSQNLTRINNITLQNETYQEIQEIEQYINIGTNSERINYEYEGMNSWRYIQNLPVQNSTNYKAVLNFDNIPQEYGKYWFCVMPCSYGTNVQNANQNNHLYCLDPWYNITSGTNTTIGNLDVGIQGYWNAENNTNNSLNNNVAVAGTGMVNYRTGRIGSAFNFTGGSNATNYVNLTTFDLNTTKNYSMSFWFKADSISGGSQLLTQNKCGLAAPGFIFDIASGLRFYVSNGGTAYTTSMAFTDTTSWHHVVGTFNTTSNNITLYVDGVYKQRTLVALAQNEYTALAVPWNIGGIECANQGLDGLIDEVGVWNKTLSFDEVLLLYNNGSGLSYRNFSDSVINESVVANSSSSSSNFDVEKIQKALGSWNKPFEGWNVYIKQILFSSIPIPEFKTPKNTLYKWIFDSKIDYTVIGVYSWVVILLFYFLFIKKW